MITLDKQYKTRCGYPVEVHATDLSGDYPVLYTYIDNQMKKQHGTTTVDGRYDKNVTGHNLNLIEIYPYDHIKTGDVVFVWDNNTNSIKKLRIFLGVRKNGRVATNIDLDCLYTTNIESCIGWDNCELYAAKGD